ncbi:MAG: PulJ/GspJ family protein, partial [Comamonas sp.]
MRQQQGFTLVEVLVALAIMALIGSMSWIGISTLLQTKEHTAQMGVKNAQLQITLAQWANDLDQAWQPKDTQPMGWDGKVFRLTRRAQEHEQGVVVVAWAVRTSEEGMRWMRWQSQPFLHMHEWMQAWELASNWARSTVGQQAAAKLIPASVVDVYLWEGSTWVNAQSSQNTERNDSGLSNQSNSLPLQPKGVRLVLHTPSGKLIQDWIAPTWSEQ